MHLWQIAEQQVCSQVVRWERRLRGHPESFGQLGFRFGTANQKPARPLNEVSRRKCNSGIECQRRAGDLQAIGAIGIFQKPDSKRIVLVIVWRPVCESYQPVSHQLLKKLDEHADFPGA